MSYILEALKRADADRARGTVPGLHTPTAPLPTAARPTVPARAALPWLLAATALAGVGAGGWWWGAAGQPAPPSLGTASPADASPRPQAGPAAPHGPATVAAPAVSPASTGTAAAAAVALAPQVPDAADALARPVISPMAAEHAAAARPRSAPPARGAEPSARPRKPDADSGRATAAAATARVPTAAELPPDIRRQLPGFSHNGHSHSPNPALRLLIVQRQVYREGDRLGPDWTLEEIGAKAAVLNFRGHRYQVPL